MEFKNKRILVTGSSRGIGFAIAKALLAEGARVAINGRSEKSTSEARAKLGNHSNTFAAPGDVSTVKGCSTIVGSTVEALGGLDILINSAGVGLSDWIEKFDEKMWDSTLNTNLKGTFFCIQSALPELRKSQGNIVNIASDAGLMGTAGLVAYCASKAGVVNMTKAMALELAPEIRVNCVCPGYVDTDMVRRDYIDMNKNPEALEQKLINYAPLKRIATAEEIAYSVLHLASDKAGNITGASLQTDGGSTSGL